MRRYWKLITANLLALCLGAYVALYGFGLPGKTGMDPDQIEGLFWPYQKQLTEFELTDHNGRPFNLQSLSRQWNLVFFGYTYCPDICPVTMAMLHEASVQYHQQAPEEFKDFKVIFVSVDGERDQTEHLASYIRFYNESWLAASGDKASVDSLTKQLGVPYEIEPHEPGDKSYLVSHSGTLFLLSPEGKLVSTIQPPHDVSEVVDRLIKIREFFKQNS